MVAVSDGIAINAPPAAVFEYLDEPANHRTITPAITGISNIEPLDNGGKELAFTYRMVAVEVDGHLVQTAHEPPTCHRFEMDGALSGELIFDIEAAGDGSWVTYTAEYTIPGQVIATVIEPFVRRYNKGELQSTLANLKAKIEAA